MPVVFLHPDRIRHIQADVAHRHFYRVANVSGLRGRYTPIWVGVCTCMYILLIYSAYVIVFRFFCHAEAYNDGHDDNSRHGIRGWCAQATEKIAEKYNLHNLLERYLLAFIPASDAQQTVANNTFPTYAHSATFGLQKPPDPRPTLRISTGKFMPFAVIVLSSICACAPLANGAGIAICNNGTRSALHCKCFSHRK